MKRTVSALAGLAIAAIAAAQLARYKEWAKSAEAYFLTPEERAEWSRIGSDADAEKFIAVYWAKRRPGFREEIQRRIAAADEQFKMRRQRGGESARGRVYITLGSPSRRSQSRAGGPGAGEPLDTGASGGKSLFESDQNQVTETWTYGKEKFDPALGIGSLRAVIGVDPQRGADELQNAGEVNAVIAKVVAASIANPVAATAPAAPSAVQPAVPPAATGPAGAAANAPAAAPAVALPAATRASLETILKTSKEAPGFWGGAFHANTGDLFYALEFYFAGEKAPSGPVKFGGVVTNEAGGEVAAFWEDAVFSDMKTGARADKEYDRSIVLPAGTYRAAFGIFSAENAAALQSASASFQLSPAGTGFDVSPLILTNELKPLTKRPAPTDPFVFGVDKPIKVTPKADCVFSKQDSLWYFYSVTNPKLPEPAPAGSATPAPSATPGAAVAPPAAETKPRIMQRIGVLRDGKPAFAPFTGPAEMQILSPGYYASGSEIPLATFEPGYYTFTLNVRDLNAARDSAASKGVDRQADFVVLKPDGTLPEKAVPKAAPAPTPKPKPKKS